MSLSPGFCTQVTVVCTRWSKIYSESDDVNVVQKFIRSGHQETVDKCLRWIDDDGSAARGDTFCDAGCGVGTLAIPLAERGAQVRASDISEAMAMEGKQRAATLDLKGSVTFETADLETLDGKYDTTTCIDVSIAKGFTDCLQAPARARVDPPRALARERNLHPGFCVKWLRQGSEQ